VEDNSLPKKEPKIRIIDGMPCIELPPGSIIPKRQPPQIQFHIIDLRKKPKDFKEMQRQKELTFFDKLMKELDEFFKGWF
jgi:hypothetical protein